MRCTRKEDFIMTNEMINTKRELKEAGGCVLQSCGCKRRKSQGDLLTLEFEIMYPRFTAVKIVTII